MPTRAVPKPITLVLSSERSRLPNPAAPVTVAAPSGSVSCRYPPRSAERTLLLAQLSSPDLGPRDAETPPELSGLSQLCIRSFWTDTGHF